MMDPPDPKVLPRRAAPRPGARGGLYAPGVDRAPPGVDDRLVEPETRQEIIGGVPHIALPARPPHAMRHCDLAYVLRAHVAQGYVATVDMLTRSDEESDFAPDASVVSDKLDLVTCGRHLEEMAFEVTDRQRLAVPTEKARRLSARGVRRVFCILVNEKRMLEWSRGEGDWRMMGQDEAIEDPCLARPLGVRALLEAAAADDAVAAALLARGTPALREAMARRQAEGKAEGKAEGRAEGKAEGKLEIVRRLVSRLGFPLDEARAARLAAVASETLEAIAEDLVGLRDAADVAAVLDRRLANPGFLEEP